MNPSFFMTHHLPGAESVAPLQAFLAYFGEANQWEKLKEECLEFVEAQDTPHLQHTRVYEVADVLVVALQLYLAREDVRTAFYQKMVRTTQRIADGYYEKDRAQGGDNGHA